MGCGLWCSRGRGCTSVPSTSRACTLSASLIRQSRCCWLCAAVGDTDLVHISIMRFDSPESSGGLAWAVLAAPRAVHSAAAVTLAPASRLAIGSRNLCPFAVLSVQVPHAQRDFWTPPTLCACRCRPTRCAPAPGATSISVRAVQPPSWPAGWAATAAGQRAAAPCDAAGAWRQLGNECQFAERSGARARWPHPLPSLPPCAVQTPRL